jgi:hypothetical protein
MRTFEVHIEFVQLFLKVIISHTINMFDKVYKTLVLLLL